MIIQTLVSLYNRLSECPEIELPSEGYSQQKISFAFVLDINGKLTQVKDLRRQDGKKTIPKLMLLPSIERSGQGFSPQFMWDNTQYTLGVPPYDKSGYDMKKQARAIEAFESFKKYHHDFLSNSENCELLALHKFLTEWNPSDFSVVENMEEIAGSNIVFILDGERKFIHEMGIVKEKWSRIQAGFDSTLTGRCLLTDKRMPLARLHPMLKNVDGAQPRGAAIVSFNKSAFCSYNKEQAYNSPLNKEDAFKYTASLNYLLRRGSLQRIKIGDSTTVFWTERASPFESFMGVFLDPQPDSGENIQLQTFLVAAKKGVMPAIPEFEGDVKFYILGLSPNNSRLAVRFWHVCSVAQLMDRIGRHFNDLEIERYSKRDIQYPGIWHLLKETARETKDISPVLGGALIRSILEGIKYPMNLFHGVLNRIKAEQAKTLSKTGRSHPNVNYIRASILKAVLKRNFNMEVPMSLDLENKNIAYLLGRLFAVLEKAQKDALGMGINATIKDRFYSSASTCPAGVFPRLLRLANHHIEKAEYGYISDRRIGDIMENIKNFPPHLNIQQQGLFAIAYYQQKNDLYKKQETKSEGEK